MVRQREDTIHDSVSGEIFAHQFTLAALRILKCNCPYVMDASETLCEQFEIIAVRYRLEFKCLHLSL